MAYQITNLLNISCKYFNISKFEQTLIICYLKKTSTLIYPLCCIKLKNFFNYLYRFTFFQSNFWQTYLT